ncbi:UNVERIFIED_CONTAM: Retrovirus-related Pol polyprotein from transposon TNT 1-94 [Sesamum latifolium]|uniref:Retrovirus-related Pol polyprotein from transposon TNT 1-94 n=1 Tax=Sesamum latifolium TaxID=2727402 RepID=A0AAW2VEX1_9LAMI
MDTNKFNGTNYNDWLRNLRIVLDFENQGYLLDKPLPTALPEGSSPEERLAFDKWLEDNSKICRDKSILRDQDGEGSSVQSHGVKKLSLVEKLEDLKARLENDTYIYVILQSLPPSYDPFIFNYNMNGLEKSIHELINMLVQYEVTTHKSEPAVLVGEASTSNAKDKGARCWKRRKGKGTTVTATASTRGAPAAPTRKSKGKVGSSQRSRANNVCMHCQGKGHWKRECPQLLSNPGMFVVEVNMISNSTSWVLDTGCGAHICNNLQVLKRSRKLSKDEMVLRLGDGKAVAAKPWDLSLVISNRIRIELKDYFYVSNVCGPLSTPARGGFSYFITFTDDHSRYSYVYLMRYKSEAFEKFKEYRLEVENQTGHKIKSLRSNRGEFFGITPSFWGYALETAAKLLNIAPSKTVPQTPYEIWHGKPASYKYFRVWGSPAYVKRLVGDNLDSRSSLCRFIEYPKETVGYYFYKPAEEKIFISRNVVFLEKGFPTDSRYDEVLIEESSEELQHDSTTPFEPPVYTDGVPVLRRSTRESRVLERPEDFTTVGEEKKVCRLQRSIYGLKQASRSWNTRFDKVIRGYDFIKNNYDPCDIKAWLSTQFSMKDMGEASYILGIKIYMDRSRRMLGLTQSSYIEKVLKRFKMEHSKRGPFPIRHRVKLSKTQSPKTDEELKRMSNIPYASAVGSIQYAVQCTRPDVAYALSIMSRYQECAGVAHWGAVKSILKYLKRTKDMFLIYGGGELILEGYIDASFQLDDDDVKSQSGFVFKLNGGVVAWRVPSRIPQRNLHTSQLRKLPRRRFECKTTSKSWMLYIALLSP